VPTCSAIASTGLDISYETIRSWVLKFGPVSRDGYEVDVIGRLTDGIWARSLVRIAGERMCLWRAVDHEGEVLDMLVQRRRNTRSARRRTIGKTPLRQNDRRPCFIPVSPKATLSGNAMRIAALLLARNRISPSFTGRRTVALEQPQR
jgi:transposase-like protein